MNDKMNKLSGDGHGRTQVSRVMLSNYLQSAATITSSIPAYTTPNVEEGKLGNDLNVVLGFLS